MHITLKRLKNAGRDVRAIDMRIPEVREAREESRASEPLGHVGIATIPPQAVHEWQGALNPTRRE